MCGGCAPASAARSTSLLQASLQQMYWFAAAYFSSGAIARPMGTAHPLIAPYQTFRCAEGAIAIGGGNQANWQRIAEVLGHPEWVDDPRFRTGRDRLAHQAALEALITQALSRTARTTGSSASTAPACRWGRCTT